MLNEFRSTSITWDKATRRIYSPITANESDSNGRKLNIQVVNSGQVENLTGATLHLYWETKDKAQHGLDAFTASNISKGEFEIYYTTGMLSNVGELNATLVLVDATGKVVSDWFKITVTRGIDDDAIQSENSFTTLTQALIDISNLETNYAPRLNNLTAQLQQTDSRVDTLIELPEGSTTNDARLEDIKIGADGIVYDSPGNAVREQISKIQSQTTVRGMLEADTIPGTIQELTFTDGNVTLIQHKNGDGTVEREDIFTYATNLIVEQRTLSTGERMVFHYRLNDFSTQVLSRFQKLYRNELVYSPDTWVEWQGKGAAVVEDNFLKVENLEADIYPYLPTQIKPNTKYGILFYIRENTRTTSSIIISGSGGAYPFPTVVSIAPGATGSFKSVQTTNNYTTSADFRSAVTKNAGKLVYGDIRVIELPTGSKIEQDFNTLTAELLNIMYPWEVL